MPTQVATTFLGARGEVVDGEPSPALTKVSQSFDGLVLHVFSTYPALSRAAGCQFASGLARADSHAFDRLAPVPPGTNM
jgi:hypothetical protein